MFTRGYPCATDLMVQENRNQLALMILELPAGTPMAMDNSQFIDDVPSYKPPLSSEISHLPSDFPVIFQWCPSHIPVLATLVAHPHQFLYVAFLVLHRGPSLGRKNGWFQPLAPKKICLNQASCVWVCWTILTSNYIYRYTVYGIHT